MELRSCTHLHFIRAVKGGLVKNIQNVNRGRPVLKFKNLKDVYEAEDSKNQNSFLQPKEEFEGFIFDRITKADPNDSEFSSSDDNGGSDSDLDDLGAGKMTLQQIVEECKAKKRKRLEFIDSRTEELCTHIKQETVEDECDLMEPLITWKSKFSKKVKTKLRCMKDRVSTPSESALSVVKEEQEEIFFVPVKIKVEPGSLDTANAISFNGDSSFYDNQVDSWGNSQKPREGSEMVMNCDKRMQASCSDSQNKTCFVRNSSIYDNQVDSCGDSQNPREVTEICRDQALCSDSRNPREMTEIAAECNQGDQEFGSASQNPREVTEIAAECDQGTQALCSERQMAICVTGNSSIYDNQVDCCGIVPREVTETVTECDWGTEPLISLAERPQQFVSVAYLDSMEDAKSEPGDSVSGQVDSCGIVPREVTEIATEAIMGTDKLISLIEDPHRCVMNEVCYEYVGHAFSEPLQIASDSFDDIQEADIPEINSDQCSDLPISESSGDGYADQPLSADSSIETVLTNDCRSDIQDDFRSPASEEIPSNIDGKEVQIHDLAIQGCLQYAESSHGSDACAPDGNAKDDLLFNLDTSALHSSDGKYSSDPESWFTPLADGSPTTEEKQSQRSNHADAERNCSSEMLHKDACEELMTSDDGDNYSKQNCPPQRLLSTRKTISPDSQEKLCKAMESIDLQEEEHYRPQKELSFRQQTVKETKIYKAERPAKITRIRFCENQKQKIVKSKNEKGRDQPEGVPKDTNLSHPVPRFSTGCNSIEICSESAIAFSQRQMQDIECLATKLTNELKTMKEIAEDRLYSQASPASSLKYKANEVRMAIKNATKVEQLANRWLMMMSRDCNRFCKIMRLAEKDSDAPESESVVNKERKKITFADEAGEALCHVRFFENKSTTSLGPDTEKPEVLN